MKILLKIVPGIIILAVISSEISYAQDIPDGPYLGQTPPDSIPIVFAPGIVSINGRGEEKITFSPQNNEIFFGIHDMNYQSFRIMEMTYNDSSWSLPDTSEFFGAGNTGSPSFSPGNERVFFRNFDVGLFFLERLGDGWSSPIMLDSIINVNENIGFPSVTSDGTLYFILFDILNDNNHIIYSSKLIDGNYSEPIALPDVINNSNYTVNDPFIAPDESYLLFTANIPGGYGYYDLYVSFKIDDSLWTEPQNLGNNINSVNFDYGPSVSPDGEYIFFTRWGPTSNPGIYWVDAEIINRLNPIITIVNPNGNKIPPGFNLSQNYPNPFNPVTRLEYTIPSTEKLTITIHDLLGKEVKTLIKGISQTAGVYSVVWDGRNDTGEAVASGVYFYTLMTENRALTKKLLLMK